MIYAAHIKTKRHTIAYDNEAHAAMKSLGAAYVGAPGYRFVEADQDGWIKHDGQECPLPGSVRCDIKLRYGGAVRHKA